MISGSIFHVYKFESTRTGFKPNLTTHSAVEIIENVGIMISLFFLKFSAFKAISKAAVPLETATPYFLSLYLQKLSSNFLTY